MAAPGKVGLSVSLITLLLLSVLLAACGEATPTPARPTVTTPGNTTVVQPVTLRWSYWGSDAEVQVNKRIAAQFESLNPNIKIEHVFVPFEQYFDKVKNEWNGSKAPDIMFLSTIPNYAASGILENLQPYLDRDKNNFDLNDFYPNLLNTFKYKGALYGLPRDNDTKVIYYNKRLFLDSGVPFPKQNWTWKDLREAALKLTKSDPGGNIMQYGLAFELKTWWRLWVYQNGGELFNEFSAPNPPSKLLLNSPEAAEAIQFWADLINVDKVTPRASEMQTSDMLNNLFTKGKVAMVFGGHGKVKIFDEVQNLDWDIVGLPGQKKRVNNAGGAGYTISAFSPNKEAAWTFVRYLEGLQGQALYVGTGLIVAARRSVREDSLFLRRQNYNAQVFIDEAELGRVNPQYIGAPEVDKIMDDALAPVFEGKQKAADVLAQLPNQVEPVLKKAGSGP
ncbi:MAG TPA: sugar ABC transporter substrate-binding protein [Chloroflexia bacterium]|nr:sugar ABC transporter substrate-binding protein [Chloroflexia bacterium]